MGNPVRRIELHSQQVTLLGQTKLLGITTPRHLVISKGVKKLQIGVRRVKLECSIDLLRAFVETILGDQVQRLAHRQARLSVHFFCGYRFEQSRQIGLQRIRRCHRHALQAQCQRQRYAGAFKHRNRRTTTLQEMLPCRFDLFAHRVFHLL